MQLSYLPILILLFVLILQRRKEAAWLQQRMAKKKEDKTEMVELAKKFIDKECILSTFNSQVIGTIREVGEGAILVECKDGLSALNLDFVVRIREYPRNKNGKKKSIVLE